VGSHVRSPRLRSGDRGRPDRATLTELATTGRSIRTEVADATDEAVAWSLLDRYEPEALILVAGATPVMRPLQHQTWESFPVNWHTDVKIGSPASGGYAGSKATRRFIAAYAQEESRRAGLDISFTAVLQRMTPFGDVRRRGARAYAARGGQIEEASLQQLGELLTPEIACSALVDLVRAGPATCPAGYVLTAAGPQELS
jgi:hypothetical protein